MRLPWSWARLQLSWLIMPPSILVTSKLNGYGSFARRSGWFGNMFSVSACHFFNSSDPSSNEARIALAHFSVVPSSAMIAPLRQIVFNSLSSVKKLMTVLMRLVWHQFVPLLCSCFRTLALPIWYAARVLVTNQRVVHKFFMCFRLGSSLTLFIYGNRVFATV